jgi:DNA-binding IscR family transcriptional regulator
VEGICDVHEVFFAAQDAMLSTLASASLADLPVRRGSQLPDREARPAGDD